MDSLSDSKYSILMNKITDTDAANYWNELQEACVNVNITDIIQDIEGYIQGADEKYVFGNLQAGAKASYRLFINKDEKIDCIVIDPNNRGTITLDKEIAIYNALPINMALNTYVLFASGGNPTIQDNTLITLNKVNDKIKSLQTYNFTSDQIYFAVSLPETFDDSITVGFPNSYYGKINLNTLYITQGENTDISSVNYIGGQEFSIFTDTINSYFFLDNTVIYQNKLQDGNPENISPMQISFESGNGTNYTFSNINLLQNADSIPITDVNTFTYTPMSLINSNWAISSIATLNQNYFNLWNSNTVPTNTVPNNTEGANTVPNNTEPTNTEGANTEPTNTEPTNTEPTNTEPS